MRKEFMLDARHHAGDNSTIGLFKAALLDQSPTKRFNATGLAHYPLLLSTYIADKMLAALKTLPPPKTVTPPPAQLGWGQRLGKERVLFTEKLRGNAEDEALAARQLAEDLAVGGLRDALQSVDKLSFLQNVGRNMGNKLECA